MTTPFALADVASLIGEPTRAAMLVALLEGRALSAGELSRRAELSPAATSLHLGKLLRGGLLAVQKQGRHRYYALASARVAAAIEALGLVSTPSPSRRRALSPERAALRSARTCYDHLAGRLSVALRRALEQSAALAVDDGSYRVTNEGERWLREHMALDLDALRAGRRVFVRPCLDWSERTPHVAGALGAGMLQQMLAMRWVARLEGTRALRVTVRGERALARMGVDAAALPLV